MRIGIIGYGTVGKAVAYGFKKFNHEIYVYDVDKEKVKKTKRFGYRVVGSIEEMLQNVNVLFVCVPTPPNPDGSCNVSLVKEVVKKIAELSKEEKIVIIKSTIIVGTTDEIINEIKKINPKIKIVYNPEFLRARYAIHDFLNPDRIVIGTYSRKAIKVVKNLYKLFNSPIIITTPKTAEMIKYASNAFLATKVSFANQIKMICEKLKLNSKKVMMVVGMDRRITPSHLDPTKGPFGGGCLPKDLDALIKKTEELKVNNILLKAVKEINEIVKKSNYKKG